jgi:D-tyrosyl-tRNA(Tyr) deacylase
VRIVCQRVTEARVRVDGELRGEIGPGLVALVGIARGDDSAVVRRLAEKVARLRIFEGEDGRFDFSVVDTGGSVLSVSQFTLIADTEKGNRPSFSAAAPPDEAEPLWEEFCQELRDLGVPVATGVFGARMSVELVNDGPVTIILDIG